MSTGPNDSNPPGTSLVRLGAMLLPHPARDEWRNEWMAELEWAWRASPDARRTWRDAFRLRFRCLGAIVDALILRRRHRSADAPRGNSVAHDAAFAVRSLRRAPGFTAVVVGTLALCIGATTAVFSVVESVLLDGFGYRHVDRLVAVWSDNAKENNHQYQVSVGDYFDWRARTHSFSQLAGFFPIWNTLYAAPEGTERLDAGAVSTNFLGTLGVSPILGRDFADGEDRPGAAGAVILTHDFWSRAFGADPRIVGTSLTLDGKRFVVIGVMGPRFTFPQSKVDVLMPLSVLGSYLDRREVHLLSVIGRLRDGTSVDAAAREMSPIADQLRAEHPKDDAGLGATVRPLTDDLLGSVRRPIQLLFGAVCAVLLIGCLNVTNLMLGRARSRHAELSIRAAMGAEPAAIVQQLVVESGVIAASSAVLGIGLALLASRALSNLLPVAISRIGGFGLDLRVLAFTAGIAVAVTLVCGVAPAGQGARTALAASIADTSRTSHGRRARRVYHALVVAELALALLLVESAGLLVNSFTHLTGTDVGFRRHGIVRMKVALPGATYTTGGPRARYYQRLLERVRALRFVRAAGMINRFPLHDGNLTTSVVVEGTAASADGTSPAADFRVADGEYFKAMGIPVVAGRGFEDGDTMDSASTPVLIINESAARKLFPTASPIGRRVSLGGPGRWITVVGVVGDVHDASLRESPRAQVFLSTTQAPPSTTSLVIRFDGPVGPLMTEIRRIVASIDKSVPLFDVETIGDVLDRAAMADRFTTTLLSGFAVLALLLAAVGTYGVIASGVAERRREIGVRMALGARAQDVLAMVLREGALLFAVALPIALAAIWATTRAIQSLLFGVTPTDVPTVAVAALALAAATGVACYLPARRAARVDPTTAIRGVDG